MQDHAKIYHEHTGQVHSGWVDFGLAFGLPGLCLIFFALIFILYFGATDKSELSLNALMICLMIIPFGFIAEISYKQYFEATIFFIALASTLVAFSAAESRMKAI
jgi:O-antigen ligase